MSGEHLPHRCAAGDCPNGVPRVELMCGTHWRRVPFRLRQEVTITWRVWERTGSRGDWTAYLEARAAAVRALAVEAAGGPD